MAYTATIAGHGVDSGVIRVHVDYAEGGVSFRKSYDFESGFEQAVLNDKISRELARLNTVSATVSSVASGVWNGSPYVPPTPTQAQVDQTTYNANFDTYARYQSEVAFGLRSATDATMLALKATLLASPALDKLAPAGRVQPVAAPAAPSGSGGLTNTELRASPVPVSGSFFLAKTQGTTGDTGTKTASFAGAMQTNDSHTGAIIFVLVGTVSGTSPTMVCQLQKSYNAGTTWTNYGSPMATLVSSNTSAALHVYPAAATTTLGSTLAGVATNGVLPKYWRINYTIGGTTPSFALTNVFVEYLV